MAEIDSTLLDDPRVNDGNSDFASGQVSSVSPDSIPVNAFAEAKNMDFDPMGRLVTRRGASSSVGNSFNGAWEDQTTNWDSITKTWGISISLNAVRGAWYFDTAADESVVMAYLSGSSKLLAYGKPDTVWTNITGASYDTWPVYFAQLADRLYYCDGSIALKYVTAGFANSAITAGRVTSITITRPGSGYTSVPAITVSSGAATATAILGYDGHVVGATITGAGSGYSASAPPLVTFAAPSSGVTAQGRCNISQVPSKPQFLVSHTQRLFCSTADTGIAPDTLYVSDILDGESWDLAGNSLRIGGDGDPITGLYSWYANFLVVAKARSMWVVDCDPLQDVADWKVSLINGSVGCASHFTMRAVGRDVFFLSRDGVHALSQIESGAQTVVGLPMSNQVRDLIDRIDWASSRYFSAVYYRNRYLLAVALLDDPGFPDHVLVYNANMKAWAGYWTGWEPLAFVITGFSNITRLSFADNNGKFWTWDDYTAEADETLSHFRDDTTDVASFVITRAYDHGQPLVTKQGYHLQVFADNRSNSDTTATLSYDKDMSGTFTAFDEAVTLTADTRRQSIAKNLTSKGRYRHIQFKLAASRGRLGLHSVAVTGFADNIDPES